MALELKDQYDKIFKYCYFRVRDAYVAEDLTQEAFLKYFSRNKNISKGKQLAYLYTIARNLCIDFYRKSDEYELEEEIPSESIFAETDISLTLRQAISNLSEDLKEIILLRFANDLSISEICSIVGISRFAVYRKINGAIRQLRTVLNEEDFYG